MTNDEIESRLDFLSRQERTITREILHLINLAEERKLHLQRGYDSVLRWLVGRYAYSEAAAVRRVQAARLLRAVPSVDAKIQAGEVNLTTLSKAQSVLRIEERRLGASISDAKKAEIVSAIKGQSKPEIDRTLAQHFPEAAKVFKQERVMAASNDAVRLSVTVKREQYELMMRVRHGLGHSLPGSDLATLIAYVFEDFWKRRDPSREVAQRKSAAVAHGSATRIPAHIRRQVFQRDQARCQFVDPLTQKVCHSRTRVELDHIHPLALGGTNEPENLRCLCRAHNQFRAQQTFGVHQTHSLRN